MKVEKSVTITLNQKEIYILNDITNLNVTIPNKLGATAEYTQSEVEYFLKSLKELL